MATGQPEAIRVVQIHPYWRTFGRGFKKGVGLALFLLLLAFILLSPHPSVRAHVPGYEAQQAESAHWSQVMQEQESARQAEYAATPGAPYPTATFVPSAKATPEPKSTPLPTPGNGER
jgi:hypothetical protein